MKRIVPLIVLASSLVLAAPADDPSSAFEESFRKVPLTMHWNGSIREALGTLFSNTTDPYDIDPCVTGSVKLDVSNATVGEVFSVLARKANLTLTRTGRRYQVGCVGKSFALPPADPTSERSRNNEAERMGEQSGSARCRDEYSRHLWECTAAFGVPRITEFNPKSGRVFPVPEAQACVEGAKVELDHCLRGAFGTDACSRLAFVNGAHQLRAYDVIRDDELSTYVVVPAGHAGKATVWVLNGFPDTIEEAKRCRVDASLQFDGTGSGIFKNELNGGVHEYSKQVDLKEGPQRIEIALTKSKPACWFGFAVAWIEFP